MENVLVIDHRYARIGRLSTGTVHIGLLLVQARGDVEQVQRDRDDRIRAEAEDVRIDLAIPRRPLAQDLADVPLVGDKNSVSMGRNIGHSGLVCQWQTWHIMLRAR